MVSATDGSAFTSSVTVEVTIDAGTQATGTVGSGACTHEGNGYHTYAPSQGETNGTLIAFTFHGTGAVPATVQVYTTDDLLSTIVEAQGSYTAAQALSIALAVLAGVTTDSGATLKTPNGSATRVAATINGSNERTAMTLTP